MKISVTKEFTFDSAHSLRDYVGPCANMHGHTYKLQITVKGERSANGLIMDFKDLKQIVKDKVINKLDHAVINEVMDTNPTAENMLAWIWTQIHEDIRQHACRLAKIRLWETPTSFATMEV